jgi:hypothetical protein
MFQYKGTDNLRIVLIPHSVPMTSPSHQEDYSITDSKKKLKTGPLAAISITPLTKEELDALSNQSTGTEVIVHFILGAQIYDSKILASKDKGASHNACRLVVLI